MTKGFDRNKFDVVGNGPDKPVASNDNDRRPRPTNRRTGLRGRSPMMHPTRCEVIP
jgi:outer membrane protein OmpA-like peptidoglycan-associated protein